MNKSYLRIISRDDLLLAAVVFNIKVRLLVKKLSDDDSEPIQCML